MHSQPTYPERRYNHRGILDPNGFADEVTLRCYEPGPASEPFVDVYFVARWQRPGQKDYQATDILTRPVVNLFFTNQGSFYNGVTQGTRSFRIGPNGVYAGIKFKPGAFRAFWKQPMSALADARHAASDIFPAINPAFVSQLLDHSDDQEAIRAMERLILDAHPYNDPKIKLVNRIITSIETSEVPPSVSSLAKASNMSARSLQFLFQNYIGVGPKWAIKRWRLLQTIQQAARPDKPNWTAVAAELNYSTQSHFSNDFRQLLGISPSRYAQLVRGSQPKNSKTADSQLLAGAPITT